MKILILKNLRSEEGPAALVARAAAAVAAVLRRLVHRVGFRRVREVVPLHVERHRPAALRAQPAAESLAHHARHGGRDEERLHAHVDHAGERARRRVRVQRGEHHVARERRVDGDFGRLAVADFADHDDVRVLTQERAQGAGEVHADLGLHLHLVDARHVVFDRVLGRHDADVDLVHLAEERVERRGLAGTGRTRQSMLVCECPYIQ